MEKIPLTPRGAQKLRNELMHLMSNERPEIIKAIATARDYGDLKENAEYHAAREKQSFIEGRIKEIEAVISRASIIDPTSMSGETVKFGATVTILYLETEQEQRYQLVGEPEADTSQNRISVASPVARALIGKSLGEVVTIKSPRGNQDCEIIALEYL
ncbi:MAG: transcription elongation factor GreA [Alphaproteobacteria bacterium]|nr:transcription elongation factor GreA [Alphaproteobacteria bacterium]